MKLKILVLNYEYPPVGGGGGAVSHQIAAALADRGHQVRVKTAWLRGLPRRETRDGVLIERVFSFRRAADRCSVAEMFSFLLCAALPAWRLTSRWRPDVIHVHFAVPTGALAWLLNRLCRLPYVMTTHLGDVPGGVPEQTDHLFRLLTPLTRPIWKRAAAVTGVSAHVAALGEQAYGRPVSIVLNGVKLVSAAPKTWRTPWRLLFAGRFQVQKNLPFLLRALALIRHESWRLDLAGDGEQRAQLTRLCAELGLQDRVVFHGWCNAGQVQALMREAHLLLMPSLHEGLPMTGIEALANGVPIIGSQAPGLKDVIDDGVCGLMLPTETPATFADGLAPLLQNPVLLRDMSVRALEKAQQFQLSTIIDRYERILQTAVQAQA